MTRPVRFGLGLLVMLLLVGLASNSQQFERGERRPSAPAVLAIESGFNASEADVEEPSQPIELPESVVIALAIALSLAVLVLLWRQGAFSWRIRRPQLQVSTSSGVAVTEEEHAEQAAEFARDLIDELREGDSPRYAIQRAYAAVETGFGAPELTRKPAETPLRYLDRVFGRHGQVREPLQKLTDLFQHARYSSDPVDESMRQEAITALTAIREHYVAVAWKRIGRSRAKARA